MVDETDVLTVHPMMQYQYGVTVLKPIQDTSV